MTNSVNIWILKSLFRENPTVVGEVTVLSGALKKLFCHLSNKLLAANH